MGLVHRRAFMAASAASVVTANLAHAQTPTANNVAWGTMTRAARDAAYNNSQAVSDSAQIVNRWVAASGTFRSQRPKHLDVAYGPGERNKWDLFPADNGDRSRHGACGRRTTTTLRLPDSFIRSRRSRRFSRRLAGFT
jgi:hypothetical protein